MQCGAAVAAQGWVPLSSAALGSVQVMWEQSLEVMVSPAGRQHLEHSSSRNVGSKHDVQEAPHPPVPVRALGALVMPLLGFPCQVPFTTTAQHEQGLVLCKRLLHGCLTKGASWRLRRDVQRKGRLGKPTLIVFCYSKERNSSSG